jgi:outer membrane biosynthesis protein TonB
MAIMDNATEESEFGVDTPVVAVDLPESFVTSPAPVRDLPPGPPQLEQSDPTPPQREEKPPEPQAELSLPMPGPRNSNHRARRSRRLPRRRPTRRDQSRPGRARLQPISSASSYPDKARPRGDQGTTTVAFTIEHDGRLVTSRVVQRVSESSFVVPIKFSIK